MIGPVLPTTFAALLALLATPGHAADKPIKVFILAGQSNMVGWGDSTKLPDDLRKGNDRVLMFEDGKWQPLRPHEPANQGQRRVGLTEFHFGPEIAFGHQMAKAWPEETIGILKFSIGGTSLLAWKPDWSKEDADRVGQGRLGSLFKRLMEKADQAKKARDIEIVGFLWLQGGGDMKNADVAREYLDNLKSLVTAVRKDTAVADLPFIYGSARQAGIPDDLSDLVPKPMDGQYPAAQWVLKAQFDAQKAIANSKVVILRDIEKHPKNVHFNTPGQLEVGKLFAEAFLGFLGQASNRLGGKTPLEILAMLGAKGEDGLRPEKLEEYVTNRIITDEAKAILTKMDEDGDGKVAREEFITSSALPEDLSKAVFNEFDTDGDGELVIPEYLRVWGRWARGR